MDTTSTFDSPSAAAPIALRVPGAARRAAVAKHSEPRDVTEAFERFAAPVWRVLKRLGVMDRILEDATQDVFIVAHRRWDSFRGASSRKTWLFGIAVRVAKMYRSRQQRPAEQPGARGDAGAETSAPATGPSPYEATASVEASAALQSLLDQLDSEGRSLVVLVYLEDLSVADAARSLGINPYSAYKRLAKARKVLAAGVRRSALAASSHNMTETP